MGVAASVPVLFQRASGEPLLEARRVACQSLSSRTEIDMYRGYICGTAWRVNISRAHSLNSRAILTELFRFSAPRASLRSSIPRRFRRLSIFYDSSVPTLINSPEHRCGAALLRASLRGRTNVRDYLPERSPLWAP